MTSKTREIVKIDEELCDGCGECIMSCAEGALQIIDGKAKLVSDNLCDGFGVCLGTCPQDAITIIKRDADEFDEEAVKVHLGNQETSGESVKQSEEIPQTQMAACPGSAVQSFAQPVQQVKIPAMSGCPGSAMRSFAPAVNQQDQHSGSFPIQQSKLTQWPVQLMLVPPTAPFLKGRELLLAADCCPFAFADFHNSYLKDKSLLIACPKLDNLQFYREKMEEIFRHSGCTAVSVMIMEVPCCGGLSMITREALKASGRDIPLKEIVVGIRGEVLSDKQVA
ncbi:MAG: 4Fe-4S dicluster domain-containing protein [Candidatus Zixiibacteriota bacterium]